MTPCPIMLRDDGTPCGRADEHRHCASCGLSHTEELCTHHVYPGPDDWAEGNRLICDLLHRKKEPRRLPLDEREREPLLIDWTDVA